MDQSNYNEMLEELVDHLLLVAIPTPTTETLQKNIQNFQSQWNYPNCCGAIDGKHVLYAQRLKNAMNKNGTVQFDNTGLF